MAENKTILELQNEVHQQSAELLSFLWSRSDEFQTSTGNNILSDILRGSVHFRTTLPWLACGTFIKEWNEVDMYGKWYMTSSFSNFAKNTQNLSRYFGFHFGKDDEKTTYLNAQFEKLRMSCTQLAEENELFTGFGLGRTTGTRVQKGVELLG